MPRQSSRTHSWSTRVLGGVFLLPLLLAALIAAPTGSAAFAPDGSFLKGYLAWNEKANQGDITWTKPNVTLAGPAAMSKFDRTGYGIPNYNKWSEHRGKPPNALVDVFRSPPLNRTLYVNLTQPIQLNLTAPTIVYDVEVWLDDGTFVGGIWHPLGTDQISTAKGNTGLWGYPEHRRMTFRSAVERIPEGARIEVRVFQSDTRADAQYDLKQVSFSPPQEWNTFRIPLYRPSQVVYRYEEQAFSGMRPADAGGSGAALALAFAGTPLWTLSRRRPGAAAAMVLLLATAVAGCLGDAKDATPVEPGPADAGDDASYRVLPGDGVTAIYGTVHDHERFPIPNVLVTMLGASNQTSTDGAGQFYIGHVAPGRHTLVFAAPGFRTRQESFDVPEGKAILLQVGLDRINQDPNARRHNHDLWPLDTTRLRVFDNDVVFPQASGGPAPAPQTRCEARAVDQIECASPAFQLPATFPGRDGVNKVFPGTKEVQVRVTTQNQDVNWVGVLFQPTGEAAWSRAYPVHPGEVVRVPTTFEMTDDGHSLDSRWSFKVYLPLATPQVSYDTTRPFHVQVEILKGVLPMEPPHRDLWRGNQTRPVIGYERPTGERWTPSDLMPPGTRWFEAILHSNYDPPLERTLTYTTAAPGAAPKPVAIHDASKPTKVVYRQAICESENDAYYQTTSRWGFGLVKADDPVAKAEEEQVNSNPNLADLNLAPGPLEFALTVIAHRDDGPGRECPP